jgi:VWFA-related protein
MAGSFRIGAGAVLIALLSQGSLGSQGSRGSGVARMDAIAIDAQGRPVRDLGPADFEIIEGGSPRPIESVQFIGIDGTLPAADSPGPIETSDEEQTEAARDGTRLFAIFLDEYHVSPGPGVARVRAALTEFVDRNLGPRDLALIVKPLDSLPNLRLTRDRSAVRNAIATFDGRKGDYTPRTAFEQDYIASTPPRVDEVRAQVVVSALNAIAVHLGTLRGGRKTIIVISEGFGRVSRRRGDPVGLPSVDTVVRSANRSGVSIYPIDPRALAVDVDAGGVDPRDGAAAGAEAASDIDTLRALAQGTDGHAILSTTDVNAGFAGIVSDSSGYYVIAFQPAFQEETGRFHAVTVRATRPGVALRTRTGYWEPVPDAAAALRALEPVVPPMAHHASPLIRPWFGFTRADDGKTRVQFVWEPAGRIPGDRPRTESPVRVRLNVLNADGTLAFEGIVGTASQSGGTEQRPDALAGGEQPDAPQAAFDILPGRVYLRMQIEDETARLLDTDVRDLVVRPVAGPVALGTALVLRARNAREFRSLDSDPAANPVVTRQFSRTERLLIRIPVYASDGIPDLTVRLATAKGQGMRELAVTAEPGSNVRRIDLPLAGLAPAEYRIEFLATKGDATAQDSLTFRVTP